MAKRGPKTEQQFVYWHQRRKGMSQSDIARKHDITRQAVSKSVKLQEREVIFRLLDTAQTSGVLVEWYDERKGVLIGLTPQLGNLACIMIIDTTNRPRVFFDQERNEDVEVRRRTMEDLRAVLDTTLGMKVDRSTPFNMIIEDIING
jgi:hypothetical protein